MIYELRSYDLAPGTALEYLALFREKGLPYITQHLPMLGYWVTETGRLNRLHHLWVYENLADRTARRQRAALDIRWTEGFVPLGFPMIRGQMNRFMMLEVGSADLDAAARQSLAGPAFAGSAMTKEGTPVSERWLSLVESTSPEAMPDCQDLIGLWRVASGHHVGRGIAIWRHADEEGAVFPDRPTIAHELLRPATFSRL